MVQPLSQEMIERVTRGEWIPCSVVHMHSCEKNTLLKFLQVFNMASKFYIPIHLVPVLVFKRDKLVKKPVEVIKNLIVNIIRSCLFLSTYVAAFWYLNCFFKNYRRKTDKVNIILSSFICSFACMFELPSRRTELALYMFPRFLESIFLLLEKRGYIQSVANGEVLVFAVAMAIIMYCYQNEESNIKSNYLNLFKKYWGSN